ncbi:MAG: YqgE/AlgH family protein [Ignavibacteria bacterium]|nr:YqgE/AlgH family protein [Ignavibacteria bacterium]
MIHQPAKGKLLLAEPFMQDPNFKRSVVLLCEHNETGTFGFVINKITELTLNDVVVDFPDFDAPVYFGGPVQPNTLQFIYRGNDIIANSIEITEGIYWGGSFEELKDLIREGAVSSENFLFLVGYCGWDEGQLENEMQQNSWVVADANEENVFAENPHSLWNDVMKKLGKKYAVMASFPEDPIVN